MALKKKTAVKRTRKTTAKKSTAKKSKTPIRRKVAAKKATVSKKKVAAKRKVTAKKKVAAAKKASVKKSASKKKTAAKKSAAAAKPKSIGSKQTKLQILQTIADETGLTRKQVGEVFSSLGILIRRHMQKRGSGEFTIPDTGVKIRRVVKPARKARMGRNPATGEAIRIPAKRASTVIKVTALKALKDTLG